MNLPDQNNLFPVIPKAHERTVCLPVPRLMILRLPSVKLAFSYWSPSFDLFLASDGNSGEPLLYQINKYLLFMIISVSCPMSMLAPQD